MILTGAYQPSQNAALNEAVQGLVAVKNGTRMERRAAIQRIEDELIKLPQTPQPLEHHFVDGLYMRRIFNPKGSLITTKIHREGNITMVNRGELLVITETGQKTIHGGDAFATEPGTKRVIVAIQDTTLSTVHPNPENLRDLEALEARIIAPDFSEFQEEVL